MATHSNVIRRTSELPAWFDLKKYKDANSLDAAGWYEQLKVRRAIVDLLADAADTDADDFERAHAYIVKLCAAVQEAPIVGTKENETLLMSMGAPISQRCLRALQYSLGVRLATVSDFYHAERSVQKEKRQYARAWSAAIDSPDFSNLLSEGPRIQYAQWFDDPIDTYISSNSFGYTMRINPLLPDKVLIEQFASLLDKMRSSNKEFYKSPKPDFQNWIKFGVLPYFDLWIWSVCNDKTIPNRVMADAIFPAGEGGEEVVRKTTSRITIELLNHPNLETLAARAAYELSEGKP